MILVVGATGSLGGRIVRGLLEQGRDVRVFVRRDSPSEQMAQQGLAHTVQSLIDAGAQPVWGDLKDRASIEAAVAGVDTVISTANAVKRGGEDTLETVDLQGTLDLIDAWFAGGPLPLTATTPPAQAAVTTKLAEPEKPSRAAPSSAAAAPAATAPQDKPSAPMAPR